MTGSVKPITPINAPRYADTPHRPCCRTVRPARPRSTVAVAFGAEAIRRSQPSSVSCETSASALAMMSISTCASVSRPAAVHQPGVHADRAGAACCASPPTCSHSPVVRPAAGGGDVVGCALGCGQFCRQAERRAQRMNLACRVSTMLHASSDTTIASTMPTNAEVRLVPPASRCRCRMRRSATGDAGT